MAPLLPTESLLNHKPLSWDGGVKSDSKVALTAMLSRFAFVLHAAVETPAAATFLFAPSRQVSPALLASPATAPEVVLVLQNLGGLLAASVLLSIAMAIWATPESIDRALRGYIALALSSYHVFPCRRAYLRQTYGIGMQGAQGANLGGPGLHLLVHIICLVTLASAGVADLWQH